MTEDVFVSDADRRALERAASLGDPAAKVRLKGLRKRLVDPWDVKTHEQHRKGRQSRGYGGRLPRGIAGKGPGDVLEWSEYDLVRSACGRSWAHTGHNDYIQHRFPLWLRFSERRDAWACLVCDRWLETRCVHPDCEKCPNRPKRPSEDGL